MGSIIESGLYDAVQTIFYGCSCPNCETEIYEKIMHKYIKAKVLPTSRDTHENHTINQLLEYSKQNDCFILYIHSKGVTNVSPNQTYWRDFMMDYVVYLWKVCTDILQRGFHTVGVNKKYIKKYYAGNFWWADANYLKILEYVDHLQDRMNAERKLLENLEKNNHINLGDEYWFSFFGCGLYSKLIMDHSKRIRNHMNYRNNPDSIPVCVF